MSAEPTTTDTNAKRRRPKNRWELLTCGWHGHAHVGTDADVVTAADHHLVREHGGLRWHRCLRCDGWTPLARPTHPARPTVPSRDEIELPLRGRLLRDKYVLRLIALDRAIHVLILGTLAVVVFFIASNERALKREYSDILNSIGGPSQHGVLGKFKSVFTVTPNHLHELGAVIVAYAALEAAEMIGLWRGRRWAEYLTFIATILLLPIEIYELKDKVSVLKILALVLNIAIAVYLLYAKRLFGLRGGQRAEDERRRATGGWPAIEEATPPFDDRAPVAVAGAATSVQPA